LIARTIAIVIMLVVLFWCSSLDTFFSREELANMGINPNNLDIISKSE